MGRFKLFEIRKDTCYRYVTILGVRCKIVRGSIRKQLVQIAGTMSRLTPEQMERLIRFSEALVLRQINRDEIESKVENMRGSGVSGNTGEPRLVVSLTSYPGRMYDLHLCLHSLLTQTHKPDKVVLWLAEEQFPMREADVPRKVLALREFGLEIRWCPDYRSHKKIIPAVQAFPEAAIVTADDDLYYPADWLKKLWNSYQAAGGTGIHAHRCHRIRLEKDKVTPYQQWEKRVRDCESSPLLFPTSGGGVLYSPGSLYPEVTDAGKAMQLCPAADDVWLWGMGVLQGSRVQVVPDPEHEITYTNPMREMRLNADGTLYSTNAAGGNDAQVAAFSAAYPQIFEKLKSCRPL